MWYCMEILVWLHISTRLYINRGYALFKYLSQEKKNACAVFAPLRVFVCKLMRVASILKTAAFKTVLLGSCCKPS